MDNSQPVVPGRFRRLAATPPWYVRVFGGLFLLGSLGTYLGERLLGRRTESYVELFVHIFFLVAGMVMIHPEGAGKMMNFARRALPVFDRRQGPFRRKR